LTVKFRHKHEDVTKHEENYVTPCSMCILECYFSKQTAKIW